MKRQRDDDDPLFCDDDTGCCLWIIIAIFGVVIFVSFLLSILK